LNRAGHYWNKALTRFGHVGVPGLRAFDGAVFTTAARMQLDRRRPVILHLDHPLIHVGDQIFFRPFVQHLKEAGLDVSMTHARQLGFLFGDVRRAESRPQPGALVVSRHEVLRAALGLYGPAADYFVFYMASRAIRRPIANFFIEAFADWFDVPEVGRRIDRTRILPFAPFPDAVLAKFCLPETRPLIVLSNYIDSGLHRKLPWRERAMLRRAAQLKETTGGAVVHVGTTRDRERDGHDYSSLVDHDLRGRTTVQDLVYLLAAPNIHRVFCFDTAILHIAYLLNVETELFTRYYFAGTEREQKALAFYKFFERVEDIPPSLRDGSAEAAD
jgi:hypothetical protein